MIQHAVRTQFGLHYEILAKNRVSFEHFFLSSVKIFYQLRYFDVMNVTNDKNIGQFFRLRRMWRTFINLVCCFAAYLVISAIVKNISMMREFVIVGDL